MKLCPTVAPYALIGFLVPLVGDVVGARVICTWLALTRGSRTSRIARRAGNACSCPSMYRQSEQSVDSRLC